MKKIFPLLAILVLTLSSCKIAGILNTVLDLKTPEQMNYLTVYADLDSPDFIRIDLGDSFEWNQSKISFSGLLNNNDFASWFYSLKNNDGWSPVGIYLPDTNYGLLTGNREVYVSKDDRIVVAWNSPFEKIRIYANNMTDKYFDYYFPKPVAYNEDVILNYSDLYNDPAFYSWQSKLGTSIKSDDIDITRYPGFLTRDVMSSYHYNLITSKTLAVNKWTGYVNLGWLKQPLFSGFWVYANTSEYDNNSFYVSLGDLYEDFSVSWNYLSLNKGFLTWYRNLSKAGYLKIGFSTNRTNNYGFISEADPGSSWKIYGNNSLYVIWVN